MAFPGFVHATVPTPVTFAPVPALLTPAVKLPPPVQPEPVKEAAAPAQIVTGDGKVGGLLFVKITSSVAAVQGALVTVHLNVALVPAGTPVTPEVGEDGVVIVAVPLTTVHVPVPAAGAVAASVKLPLLQLV
jgi:hypothetical protein